VALGAGRWRLVRQLLIEMLMLVTGGALGGLAAASWMQTSIASLIPPIGVNLVMYEINARIVAFTVLVCAAAVLLAGMAPAVFSVRADVNATLREAGRSGMSSGASHRARNLLVVAEVALATVALIGAGLFTRSFANARGINPGFDRNNVLLTRFYVAGTTMSAAQVKSFCRAVRERLLAGPGIVDVNYADYAPLGSTAGPWDDFEVDGYVPARGESMTVSRAFVAPGYFRLMRIPLLEGRNFTSMDDLEHERAVIVSKAFAAKYVPHGGAVGHHVRLNGRAATIVGVVKDSKYFDVAEAPKPFVFVPFDQRWARGSQIYFFLRTTGDPMQAAGAFRREVAAVDPNAGSFLPMRLADWTEITMTPQKMAARFLSAMGLVSLLLAAVGLYSVMAYAVTQRTQEVGIRMALGAGAGDVLRMVMRQGLMITAVGVAAGVAIALAGSRALAGMLVDVSGADPLTFCGVAAFLGAVSMLACFVPARRATRVDPVTALRCE
jgi:predicted permease